jgi:cob(I)alamin adenosyltransferase
MKIYTKKGDDGTTSLLGGNRVPKHHLRIEAYGNLDELNAQLGVLRDMLDGEYTALLAGIQENLFTIGSHLAVDPGHEGKMNLPLLPQSASETLEQAMDAMDNVLPPMRNFVLPGGHLWVSQCHVVRTVCRRAERSMVALHESQPIDPIFLTYVNRLSDYFFVLSRYLAHRLNAPETPWKPAK